MDDKQLSTVLELLEASRDLDPSSPAFLALERAAAHLHKSAKKKRRLARSRSTRAGDAALRAETGLAQKRVGRDPERAPERPGTTRRERTCYVCKQPYVELHRYYPSLCRPCGDRSWAMRDAPLDLRGRRALLTGGRIKVGYATALRMLRAGAEVHVTTRFPRDAERRYREEPDAASFSSRLHLHGVDFRDLRGLLDALEELRRGPSFDVLINNAAQTVWHPPAYYEALYAGERPRDSIHALAPLAPGGLMKIDLQREDGWTAPLGSIAPVELVEVHVVNAIAPVLICNLLRSNLERSAFADRYVINVTAVEGQFSRDDKPVRHPHTNMAKAALNMLTRTSAADLATRGIHMVSVDPGWMSSEGKRVAPDVQPALEAEDCAARVLHPIAVGLAGAPLHGVLLKDFLEVPW